VNSLYIWLKFLHLIGLGVFLFGHGISGGVSLVLKNKPGLDVSRALLMLSIWSYRITYPGLLLLLVTGVWMGFAGSWWRAGWIWTSIVVLVVVFAAMSFLSVAFHQARKAAGNDTELAQRIEGTRPELVTALGVIGLLVLYFLMVFKPF
jgi:uncharacterized membrane protein